MPRTPDDETPATVGPEQDLQRARLEAGYYRELARITGKNHLRNISQLSGLVAELKEVERRLRESEERYRTVVENLNVGMLVTVDQRIVFANQAAAQFLGLSIEEILASPTPFDFIHPDDRARVLESHVRRARGEPVPENYEFRLLTGGHQTKWVQATGTRIDWKGSTGILNFFIDVTERVQSEERQRKLELQLGRAQKMEALGTLAGGIAHDFNNLMAASLAYISLMLHETDPAHPHHGYLTSVENQIRRGARLTSQLLGYARQGQYCVRAVDLNLLVREVAEAFGRTRKNISVCLNLQEEACAVEGDQGQLEQILLNLFVNASDAMPYGGTLTLTTRNTSHERMPCARFQPKPGNYVELQVSDAGIGMSAAVLERIFDPFFTTKERGRGTGLGLASVFGIVKGHGGYIDVASREGRGTTFSVYLPATDRPPLGRGNAAPEVVAGKGIVMIVDDEAMVLEAAARMLRKLGYTVHAAAGGRDALDLFQQRADELDLVILDMVMPDIGGEEVYRRIKQIRPDAKVLISSGYDCSGKMPEILKLQSDGFIHKPFSLAELSEKVLALLNAT